MMKAKSDTRWVDYLRHAEEVLHFEKSIELGSGEFGRNCGARRRDERHADVLKLRKGRVCAALLPISGHRWQREPVDDAGSGDKLLALIKKKHGGSGSGDGPLAPTRGIRARKGGTADRRRPSSS
uniref:Uncharacterized protein n=1 Tax=Peronospora matthiolae TaxID=2874970 RepID=A0AAV1TR53_9STRA